VLIPQISVVHLVQAKNGIAPFHTFLNSYKAYRAGIPHGLVFVFKGFRSEPTEYEPLLGGLSHSKLVVSDDGYDIGAYVTAASQLNGDYVAFFNSFSELLHDDWLATLFAGATGQLVGAVGATGSWESTYSDHLYGCTNVRSRIPLEAIVRSLKRRWTLTRLRRYFQPQPNPHLRTNAFLLNRRTLLALSGSRPRTKMQAMRFESGVGGMTDQLAALGLGVVIVGRDGKSYPAQKWPASNTFRSGRQENLLVADNRTRQYDQADEATKQWLAKLAWGGAGSSPS